MAFFFSKRRANRAGTVSSEPSRQDTQPSDSGQGFRHPSSVDDQKISTPTPNRRLDSEEIFHPGHNGEGHNEGYKEPAAGVQNEHVQNGDMQDPGHEEDRPDHDDGSRTRINVLFVILCIVFAGLWCRAGYLQLMQGDWLAEKARRQHVTKEFVTGRRGNIMDRDGNVLARSVESSSVYANPQEVKDPLLTANTLGPILGINPQSIYDKLSKYRNKQFVYLRRQVDDYTVAGVKEAHLPGIALLKEYARVYPSKQMAGQLLGFVGDKEKGLEGLERSLDSRLACPVRGEQLVLRDATGRRFYMRRDGESAPHGEDVHLTIDGQLQLFAEDAVAKAVRDTKAAWGGALVVDVPSGEILAWAQFPYFNPNAFAKATPAVYRNRLAQDALEPGSTFKPLVLAAAMQQRLVGRDTPINCENGRWQTKYNLLRDTSSRGIIPVSKVIRYSSNIGMAKIGLMLGSNTMYKYLHELGFGEYTSVPVSQSRGILRDPKRWSEVDTMSISFGQGVSVTPIQMAQAYLTLLNNGVKKNLVLVREVNTPAESKQVFSRNVTREIRRMMSEVVNEKDGTGRRAAIEGVEVAGKTGTAQKADRRAGAYGTKRLASFVGFLPASNPKYLILVFIDEPQNAIYGGVIAAPVFREIALHSLAYSGELDEKRLTADKGAGKQEGSAGQKGDGSRGYKTAGVSSPFEKKAAEKKQPVVMAELEEPESNAEAMRLPGHMAKPSATVPDVTGKTVRNAVELFARAGIMPELRGEGPRVVRQEPPPGTPWPEDAPDGKKTSYILWLSGG